MYLKLKQHQFFLFLLGDFQKCFKSLKEHQLMLHVRYFFTEIKTQTSSLILFGVCQEKKFLKDNSYASYKDFLFIAVQKERQVSYRRQQNEKKLASFDVVFSTLNALSKLIDGWIMKLEGLL